jgi:hypothetical protein
MKKALQLIAAILLICQAAMAQTSTFNTSGTYTVPAGVYAVSVELWGAGGFNPSNNAGAGGGAYVKSKPIAVTPGSTIPVTVGSGGSSATNSSFGGFITANGGGGQNGGSKNFASNVLVSYAGGRGGNGAVSFSTLGGGGGAAGGPIGVGRDGQNATFSTVGAGGNGSFSGGGSGGNGALGSGKAGDGMAPGGGRGGRNSAISGAGRVIVTVLCNNGIVPRITGQNELIANGDITPSFEDSTSFGEVNYLGSSKTNTYTIQNTGNDTIIVATISTEGGDAASFKVIGVQLPFTINPGTSATFKVAFSPASGGLKTTTLVVGHNHCTSPTYTFKLDGTGICSAGGTALVKFKNITIADGDAIPSFTDSTNFGDVGLNGYTSRRNYFIFNTGAGPLRINQIGFVGADVTSFQVAGISLPRIIQPGDSIAFGIVFTPQSAGSKTATAVISAEGCTLTEYDFAIRGSGICLRADDPVIKGNNRIINDGSTTPSANNHTDFGNVGFNGFALTRTFTVINPGKNPLQLTTSQISGPAGSLFETVGLNLPTTVLPGDSLDIQIRYSPSAAGQHNATFNINTGNCGIPAYDFALRGTGICDPAGAPRLLGQNRVPIADGDNTPANEDLTNFGNVAISGFSLTRSFILQNPSGVPLQVSAVSVTGSDFSQFSVSGITTPHTIAANGEIAFQVRFAPGTEGVKNAVLNMELNSCANTLYNISLTGTGVQPRITEFSSNSNFTPPPGVNLVKVNAWGAGASPGTSNNGGGGGAFVRSNMLTVGRLPLTVEPGAPGGIPTRFYYGLLNDVFIQANNANGQSGGVPTTGSNVEISYKGGNGGNGRTTRITLGGIVISSSFFGGGGGGAGGFNGAGADGANNTNNNAAAGGNGATGGGNGGRGGTPDVVGGDGGFPGGGGGGSGSYNINTLDRGGKANKGLVQVLYDCPGAGTIGTSHTVVYPPQRVPDIIESFDGVEPTPQNGLVYTWQRTTTEGSNWTTIPNATGLTYRFDRDSIRVKTWYRRVSNSCNQTLYSNVVAMNVILSPNGSISGRVLSKNFSPVKGITVYAQKTNNLPGSPATWIDSAITGNDGRYTIDRIYYGDPTEGNNNGSVFSDYIVTPFKPNHGFKPANLSKRLSNSTPTQSNVDFTDTTVYAITGKITQECEGCLNSNNDSITAIGTVDSVDIFRDGSFVTSSGFISPDFGRYSVTVTDPQEYNIEPRFKNHQFSPASASVLVEDNVNNVDFKDISTFSISGTLTAGCEDYIGTATLEFTDILPNDPNGNPRASQFRKRVTTEPGSGFYSINLPARKWQVKVVAFTMKQGGDVTWPDLEAFFETKIPKDSLVRDITTANATLNLVYNRPPTLEITGLDPVCTPPKPFAIFEQNKERTFTVKAWQGPASKNCPAMDTLVYINTNIQREDVNEVLTAKLISGQAQVTLKGGTPNIIAPHYKVLNLVYTDANNLTAQLNDTVVVTGVKSNEKTFTTVSPEIPLMILRDPPGDQSFSTWETSETRETATRFYAATGAEATAWAEVKVGASFSAGIGYEVNTDIWGSVRGSVTVSGRVNNATEVIMTNTTSRSISTASDEDVIGTPGDVFIGAAINLIYAVAFELSYNPATCSLAVVKKLVVAPDGFATEYIYTEDHIRNNVIPSLMMIRDNPTGADSVKTRAANSIKVWEQTLAMNELQKAKAAFDKNISFDGAVGPITQTTTTTATKTGTIEFDLGLNAEVAIELGLDIGGTGVSGGVSVGFKMETGGSRTGTTIKSTTIGYTLDDGDLGDFYSVNIKKDLVYGTPVFEVVAANTSCPFEPGTLPRDEMQVVVPEPVKRDVDPNGEAEFIIKIGNTSQSLERRTYTINFLQESNPNGAEVTIGGSPAAGPVPFTIDFLGEVNLLIKVKRGAANVFSYEGLKFRVTDLCDGGIEKIATVSAFFTSTCSPIELSQPEPGWLLTQSSQHIMPVIFKGYSVANTTNVTLEYQRAGSNNWITGFTLPTAQINNSVNGTFVNWNVSALTDGNYNLRMKLNCPAGVVYSLRSEGIIDRVSPMAIGNPEPTDDEFVRGDQISIQYNEPLDCSGVTPEDVAVKRLSNGQMVAVNVGCFQNRIVIVPLNDISTWVGDSLTVSVKNISDQYGNGKTSEDKWSFIVGNTIPATGPRALIVRTGTGGTPPGGIAGKANTLSTSSSVNEDANLPLRFVFELGANAADDVKVNYTVSGNAVFGKDYTVDTLQTTILTTTFNGAAGSLTLKKGTNIIELRIRPIANTLFEPNKTITITLAEGGDYDLGANVTATGTILNDDNPKVYVFTGSGNYNVPANWDNGIVPPLTVLTGDEVVIDPPNGGECILNVPVTVMPGAKFEVKPGKVLRINNALNVKKKL